MSTIESGYYRVSLKILILDEKGEKFLAIKNPKGKWNLPGGGLDWGEAPEACIRRELMEETGLEATWVSPQPCYFMAGPSTDDIQRALPVYEVKVSHFNFTPSNECNEMKFISASEMPSMDFYQPMSQFVKMFDPAKHSK